MLNKNNIDLIKEYIIDNIKIIDLLESYDISFRQYGNRIKLSCPFHDEKTPSFIVYLDSNSYHCFGGCAKSGDVISFIENYEKKTFKEVIETFKDKASISDSLIFEKLEKKLNPKKIDLHKYINSNIYSTNVFLRDYLKKYPEKTGMVDGVFLSMDRFFENEIDLDRKKIDNFFNEIMEEVH